MEISYEECAYGSYRIMKKGEQREIGCANGWRYIVERSESGNVFWLFRKSMSIEDHGNRRETLASFSDEERAVTSAKERIERCIKAVGAAWG